MRTAVYTVIFTVVITILGNLATGQNIAVQVGGSVELECVLHVLRHPHAIIWQRSGKDIIRKNFPMTTTQEGNYTLEAKSDMSTSWLRWTNAKFYQAGQYFCLTYYGSGSSEEQLFTLQVQGPPEITHFNVDYTEGDPVEAYCCVDLALMTITSDILWYIDGEQLMKSGVLYQQSTSAAKHTVCRDIKFSSHRLHNDKAMLCLVKNSLNLTTSVILNVMYPPEVDMVLSGLFDHQSSVTTEEHSDLHIECISNGNPKPTVTLHRETSEAWSDLSVTPFEVSRDAMRVSWIFFFPNVNRGFTGNYRCEAANGIGTVAVGEGFVNVFSDFSSRNSSKDVRDNDNRNRSKVAIFVVIISVLFGVGGVIALVAFIVRLNKRIKLRRSGVDSMWSLKPTPYNYYNIELSKIKHQMHVPRGSLELLEQIGSGTFADVYRAEACSILERGNNVCVAVKALNDNSSNNDKKDFINELALLEALGKHENVVEMYGYCTEMDPIYLIMEYCPNGNLQNHLRAIANNISENFNRNVKCPGSASELLVFGIQIAKGMAFLASKNYVHRDLASRNILLGEELICKISDFGLARDVSGTLEYELRSRSRVPVRWMALESLLNNIYTTKSDIWSFAIVMWEIITLGSHPYTGLSPSEVIDRLQKGYRLSKPDHCNDDIYSILLPCWEKNPAKRPNFTDIKRSLEGILESNQEYLRMDNFCHDEYHYIASEFGNLEEL